MSTLMTREWVKSHTIRHKKKLKLNCTSKNQYAFILVYIKHKFGCKSTILVLDNRGGSIKTETTAINHFTNLNPKYKLNMKRIRGPHVRQFFEYEEGGSPEEEDEDGERARSTTCSCTDG